MFRQSKDLNYRLENGRLPNNKLDRNRIYKQFGKNETFTLTGSPTKNIIIDVTNNTFYFNFGVKHGRWEVLNISKDNSVFFIRKNDEFIPLDCQFAIVVKDQDCFRVIKVRSFLHTLYSFLSYYQDMDLRFLKVEDKDALAVRFSNNLILKDSYVQYIFVKQENDVFFYEWSYRPSRAIYMNLTSTRVFNVYNYINGFLTKHSYFTAHTIDDVIYDLPNLGILSFKPGKTKLKFDTLSGLNPYSQKVGYVSFSRMSKFTRSKDTFQLNKEYNLLMDCKTNFAMHSGGRTLTYLYELSKMHRRKKEKEIEGGSAH